MLAPFLALAVRLALMPVTAHGDLFFVQFYPHLLVSNGVWDVYAPAHATLFAPGTCYYPPLVYYVLGFFQTAMNAVVPGLSTYLEAARPLADPSNRELGLVEFLGKGSLADHSKFLFLLKLPYLLFEVAGFFVLCLWFENPAEKRRAIGLWLWNPVLVFCSYVVGQYRIVSVFFTLASLVLVKKKKVWAAGLLFGSVCLMENFAVLLLPIWIVSLETGTKDRLKLLFWTGLPIALVLVPLWVHSEGGVRAAYFSPILMKGVHQGIFNAFPQWMGRIGNAIFFSTYGALMFYLVFRKRNASTVDGPFVPAAAIALLALYATHVTSVHYWMWGVPFFLALQVKGNAWRPFWTWSLVGLLFLFNLDTRSLNLGLFSPLSPGLASAPSLHEWMDRFLPWGKVVAGSRALFSIGALVLAWQIFRKEFLPQFSEPAASSAAVS